MWLFGFFPLVFLCFLWCLTLTCLGSVSEGAPAGVLNAGHVSVTFLELFQACEPQEMGSEPPLSRILLGLEVSPCLSVGEGKAASKKTHGYNYLSLHRNGECGSGVQASLLIYRQKTVLSFNIHRTNPESTSSFQVGERFQIPCWSFALVCVVAGAKKYRRYFHKSLCLPGQYSISS